VPFVAWFFVRVVVRIVRAFVETASLLADRRTLHALPWPYVRSIVRRRRLVGLAVAALVLSFVCLLGGILIAGVSSIGILIASFGLLMSWLATKRLPAA
jgi:hypothetical protein